MFRAIGLQIGATILVAAAAGLIVGMNGAVSAALAGGAVVIPNFLFALRLSTVSGRAGASYPAAFFIGEFVKIAATIGLLVIAVKMYRDVNWPSLMIGMVVTLQAAFFAFMKKS